MKKFRVKLETTFTATVWVECNDPQEAQNIAENAWRPILGSDGYVGIDPNIEAVYDWEVHTHREGTRSVDVKQV